MEVMGKAIDENARGGRCFVLKWLSTVAVVMMLRGTLPRYRAATSESPANFVCELFLYPAKKFLVRCQC